MEYKHQRARHVGAAGIEQAFAQGAREMIVVLPDSKTRHNCVDEVCQ